MAPRAALGRTLTAGVALAAALGLAGCAPSDPPRLVKSSAVAAPSATPTPEPTATPTAPAATRIFTSASAVGVVTDDGTELTSWDYRRPTFDVVAGLTQYLGEPALETFPSGNHNGEGTRYVWDDFSVSSEDRWAELPDAELPSYLSRWSVRAIGPTARGLAVGTVDGVQVGDFTADIIAAHPGADERLEMTSVAPRTDIFLGAVPPPIPEDDPEYNADYRWRVFVYDEDPVDVIQDLRAPSPNFGA